MACYSIAGLTVEMPIRHALTRSRAERYAIASQTADMVLEASMGDANQEYADLALAFYQNLLRFDGFLVHASAVELNGSSVLFSATSGTGKSTHAAYWVSQLGASILNDDKPAVRLENGVFSAYGTPFSGKHDLSENRGAPLKAVVVLRRGKETRVEMLSKREALFCLLEQTVRPADASLYEKLLSLLETLLSRVPVCVAYVPDDPASAKAVASVLDNIKDRVP